ncbi:ABC transporter substrate-binding protein [Candidatus Wolfebacteria bacterium]|nr:ABC transporter substrate-binding protein [Candidatus Wolfebacteria bacterium]
MYVFITLLIGSSLIMLGKVNAALLVEVPRHGGSITEGIIGAPRFINPLLAASDADRDLTQLVYSGLLHATPDGRLVPDLAERYSISEDGLVYTFTLRDNLRFHDGMSVTAEDVLFTVTLAQNPDVKSPKRANWEGVHVDAPDTQTVVFTLAEAYQPFLENTTLGILPKHIWEKTTPEQLPFNTFNADPVGSGPYRVTDFVRDDAGVPTRYELTAFDDHALGRPYITDLTFRFYTNEDDLFSALETGEVEHVSAITPENARALGDKGQRVETFPLPRVFGVFFNQNQAPVFTNIEVRKALAVAVPREKIVRDVLLGYGVPANGPIPPGLVTVDTPGIENEEVNIAEAQAILERNGWTRDEEKGIYVKKTKNETTFLQFTITTANIPELKHTAELLQNTWGKIGTQVDIKLFETGNLNNEVIRPREYQALLFGQIIGRDLDPFPFWHSSQRNDPGLNIALYTNITTDQILEDIRTTHGEDELSRLYNEFSAEIAGDAPAAFVYTPDFIYIVNPDLKGLSLGTVTTPAERFLDITHWYFYTDLVWRPFSNYNKTDTW